MTLPSPPPADADSAEEATLLIGEVVDRLQDDFPDVTVSKVRFLEREGLITPERSASGYRRFRVSDVARVRFVLTAQRDHYLPLKVIAAQLEAAGQDFADGDAGAASGAAQPTIVGLEASHGQSVTARELRDLAGLSADSFRGLVTFGILAADGDGCYDPSAQQVALAAARIIDLGIDVRHLRAFRTAADRELSLVEFAGLSAREQEATQVADLCLDLHARLLADMLARSRG